MIFYVLFIILLNLKSASTHMLLFPISLLGWKGKPPMMVQGAVWLWTHPEGSSPDGTWAEETSFAQPRSTSCWLEALQFCDWVYHFLFLPWAGNCSKELSFSSSRTGSDLWNSWTLKQTSKNGEGETGLTLKSHVTITHKPLSSIKLEGPSNY